MPDLHDTQPNRKSIALRQNEGLQAPPRFLFWGVIILFLAIIIGGFSGIYVFREVLQPSQQQRIIDELHFMKAFLKPTPAGGVFPTSESANNTDAMSLLDMPLNFPKPTSTAQAESTTGTNSEVTQEVEPTLIPSTAEPISTATAQPTNLPTAIATEDNSSASLPLSTQASTISTESTSSILPPTARIFGIRHEQQKWNNCGPATITMGLSFYGWTQDQTVAADFLKPNREDKNVSPYELVKFVEEKTDVRAITRIGGDLDLLKELIANQFPVIIETGEMFEAYDWIGHYRALIAYDDVFQQFYFYDSFLGVGSSSQGVTFDYDTVDRNWQAFNRTYIVIYEPQREGLLQSILNDRWTVEASAQYAFEIAQQEARQEPQNAFAWFNMGTALTELGRYQEAATAFDRAQQAKLPWRMMWYQFGPFKAYYEVARYDDVLSLVQINLNNAEELEETYYWQGRVLEAQGIDQQAAVSYRRALNYNPNYTDARTALDALS